MYLNFDTSLHRLLLGIYIDLKKKKFSLGFSILRTSEIRDTNGALMEINYGDIYKFKTITFRVSTINRYVFVSIAGFCNIFTITPYMM